MLNKKIIGLVSLLALLILGSILIFNLQKKEDTNKLTATVLAVSGDNITMQDSNHVIYTMNILDSTLEVGDIAEIEYTGLLDKDKSNQSIEVVSYQNAKMSNSDIPSSWQDNGIFKDYYSFAKERLDKMDTITKLSLIEKDIAFAKPAMKKILKVKPNRKLIE